MSERIPVVLVSGASRGIGRGIACQLAKIGMSVCVNYARNLEAAKETIALCDQFRIDRRQKFIEIRADIGLREDRIRLFEKLLTEFGHIDALVNNAGIAPRVRLDLTKTTEESYYEVLRTNLDGPFFLTQTIANYWINEKSKHDLQESFKVIFISSVSAVTASIYRGEYCISKAGLSMVAKLWTIRLADEGIHVYELRPGIISTDMTNVVKEKYDKLLQNGIAPQRRWGQPEDVGKAVGAILKGDFPYSTGSIIYVDGGLHLRKL
jgi:NAD(P)-dependent dehydrogenase (short-subunit alcohol dehydrogenase family)